MPSAISRKLSQGTPAAAASALFLGITPILGKLAIRGGIAAFGVVALRTAGAMLLLFTVILIFQREYLYIYPLGLFGCLLAGLVNGTGSLFYYLGLARVDASLGQLLYSLYPIFVALLLSLDGYRLTPMTLFRIVLSLAALLLLTTPTRGNVDFTGAMMMTTAGFLYALHIPINQRVLYDAPAPTVTFYTLVAMTLVVVPFALVFSRPLPSASVQTYWPVFGLMLVTFMSRLSLFTGVKFLGGLDTALIGLGEIIITLTLAWFWLGESLTLAQWIGVLLLAITIALQPFDHRQRQKPPVGGWLRWLLPHARYQRQDPPVESAKYADHQSDNKELPTK